MVRNIVYLGSIIVFFLGCSEENPKNIVQNNVEPASVMVKKIKSDENKSLKEQLTDDGILIDGARDEKLLDAFGLAVSQVITEEGISVPDCNALAATGYLTKEECDEVSAKYTGFYDIDPLTGEAKKVNDLFAKTISSGSVELRESEVELFDSSGNPLLNNVVEFETFVDNTNNLETLKNLIKKVPDNKKEQKELLAKKIEFLNELNEAKAESEASSQTSGEQLNTNNVPVSNSNQSGSGQAPAPVFQSSVAIPAEAPVEDLVAKKGALATALGRAQIKVDTLTQQYEQNPSDPNIFNQLQEAQIKLQSIQSEYDSL